METSILMPVHPQFMDVFETFMNEEQKSKIRANNVRQYIEGIIDLLLKDKVTPHLKPTEPYEGINWKRKLKIIREHYDAGIADKIQFIFKVGGDGSHFSGQVTDDDLRKTIEQASHIVEDIFIKYFLSPEHKFGSENIFTIFSMLPLHNRIYILENLYKQEKNQFIADRLSLAYLKSGNQEKATRLLEAAFRDKVIDENFKNIQLQKLHTLDENLKKLYEINADYEHDSEYSKAIILDGRLVVGLPTSKDVFETARAVEVFKNWFDEDKDKYPEFINLFLCLMASDNRKYI